MLCYFVMLLFWIIKNHIWFYDAAERLVFGWKHVRVAGSISLYVVYFAYFADSSSSNSSTNRLWGEIAGDFVVNQRSLIPVYTWGLVMPVRVIQNYYPLAAFMYTFITGWLSIVFIGKLMYLLNLKIGKKTIGISAAVFFIMFGSSSCIFYKF